MGEQKDFLAICQKILKKIPHFEILVNTGPYGGWKFQNATSTVFIRFEPNFMINRAVIREYKVINVLVIWQKLKILWHFEILIMESMGKS